jgi:hypothetical protein
LHLLHFTHQRILWVKRGSGIVSVTAPSGCPWTASSSAGWITITSGSSGSGNGTVSYSVAANTSTSSRTGTMTIAGQTFTVNQSGASNQTERITNGSFTSGSSGWTLWGDFWAGTNLPNPRTPPGYAAGGVDSNGYAKNNAYGTMYQTVTIPSNATSATLSFWYNITSNETGSTAYDVLNVTIQNSTGGYLATVAVLSNLNKGALGVYTQRTFDVTPYRGANNKSTLFGNNGCQ